MCIRDRIVAGDCGFGFEKKEYYEQMVRRNTKRMNQANNWIVFVPVSYTHLDVYKRQGYFPAKQQNVET